MRSSLRLLSVLASIAALALFAVDGSLEGQQLRAPLSVNAWGSALGSWPGRVDTMLRDGGLAIQGVQSDTVLPGRTYERLSQQYLGVPVFGGQLVQQRLGTDVVGVSGRVFEDVDLATVVPALSGGDAASLASADLGPGAVAGPAQLGILPIAGRFALVYRVTVRGLYDIRRYDVDATTGVIVQSRSEIRTQGAVGRGTGLLGDDKKVSAQRIAGGAFLLVDVLRPGGPWTFAFDGSIDRLNRFLIEGLLSDTDLARDSNNDWVDRPVVDAHVYSGWAQDYFFKRFGRRGVDDRNLEMYVIAHPLSRSLASSQPPDITGLFLNNALYVHPALTMFGDGDGVIFDALGGAFDVVAHEWTHAVTGFSSGLENADEPGALSEAFSDVMATGAEFMLITPDMPQQGPNFVMAEDVTRISPGHIRSMQNPLSNGNPDHYSLRQFVGSPVDSGGIHINCTIMTHAFYLAVAGGTNRVSGMNVQGIGTANIADMERIFYRAFVFMLGPLSQFSDARAATLQAAAELFGASSQQRIQLERAWTAVGVN
ncbi:MAG: M4 family metallopeptidase [Vicinamibacterales bacterium]